MNKSKESEHDCHKQMEGHSTPSPEVEPELRAGQCGEEQGMMGRSPTGGHSDSSSRPPASR